MCPVLEARMTLKDANELLSDPLLLLPKRATGEFLAYTRSLFGAFGKKMQETQNRVGTPPADQLEKIASLSGHVISAIQLALAGKQVEALQVLGGGLNRVEPELFLISERN